MERPQRTISEGELKNNGKHVYIYIHYKVSRFYFFFISSRFRLREHTLALGKKTARTSRSETCHARYKSCCGHSSMISTVKLNVVIWGPNPVNTVRGDSCIWVLYDLKLFREKQNTVWCGKQEEYTIERKDYTSRKTVFLTFYGHRSSSWCVIILTISKENSLKNA